MVWCKWCATQWCATKWCATDTVRDVEMVSKLLGRMLGCTPFFFTICLPCTRPPPDEHTAHFLRALPVHQPWTMLIILCLGHPHLLKRAQAPQNRPTCMLLSRVVRVVYMATHTQSIRPRVPSAHHRPHTNPHAKTSFCCVDGAHDLDLGWQCAKIIDLTLQSFLGTRKQACTTWVFC